MAQLQKRYAFQIGGRDYSALISWGKNSEVYMNDELVHRWHTFFPFKSAKFEFDSFPGEVRATQRGTAILLDVELYVEGRPASQLPQLRPKPMFLLHNGAAHPATMLVYDTGAIEVVCAVCGRSTL